MADYWILCVGIFFNKYEGTLFDTIDDDDGRIPMLYMPILFYCLQEKNHKKI